MTETEMADAIMEILGMDRTHDDITEVEAGFAANEIEVEDDEGHRFSVTVTQQVPA